MWLKNETNLPYHEKEIQQYVILSRAPLFEKKKWIDESKVAKLYLHLFLDHSGDLVTTFLIMLNIMWAGIIIQEK